MKVVIWYHKADFDGYLSAYLLHKYFTTDCEESPFLPKFKDAEKFVYVPYNYTDSIRDSIEFVASDDVLIFADVLPYSRKDQATILDIAQGQNKGNVYLFDHHVSAVNYLNAPENKKILSDREVHDNCVVGMSSSMLLYISLYLLTNTSQVLKKASDACIEEVLPIKEKAAKEYAKKFPNNSNPTFNDLYELMSPEEKIIADDSTMICNDIIDVQKTASSMYAIMKKYPKWFGMYGNGVTMWLVWLINHHDVYDRDDKQFFNNAVEPFQFFLRSRVTPKPDFWNPDMSLADAVFSQFEGKSGIYNTEEGIKTGVDLREDLRVRNLKVFQATGFAGLLWVPEYNNTIIPTVFAQDILNNSSIFEDAEDAKKFNNNGIKLWVIETYSLRLNSYKITMYSRTADCNGAELCTVLEGGGHEGAAGCQPKYSCTGKVIFCDEHPHFAGSTIVALSNKPIDWSRLEGTKIEPV